MKGVDMAVTKRTDPRLLERMRVHYSRPKGFVGRNICYAITHNGRYFGHIVGGSATRYLPGRDEFFGVGRSILRSVANNLFYNISPPDGRYPFRNFTTYVLGMFRERVREDWERKYGEVLVGYETLVQPPRTGELYRRDGWVEVGLTQGWSCKREAGKGTDSWTGKRVWTPGVSKIVLVRRV